MPTRRASCSCGQLAVTCEGEPVRVGVCHCLACQPTYSVYDERRHPWARTPADPG